jgi:hypothetical protein
VWIIIGILIMIVIELVLSITKQCDSISALVHPSLQQRVFFVSTHCASNKNYLPCKLKDIVLSCL